MVCDIGLEEKVGLLVVNSWEKLLFSSVVKSKFNWFMQQFCFSFWISKKEFSKVSEG